MHLLSKFACKIFNLAKGCWKPVGRIAFILTIGLSVSNAVVFAQQAGLGKSYGALLQGITPEQRAMLNSLTPDQRQSLKDEVISNGGVLTPELIDKLKAQAQSMSQQNPGSESAPASDQTATVSGQMTTPSEPATLTTTTQPPATETAAQADQNISAAEEKEEAFEDQISKDIKIGENSITLTRFGFDFFASSRKRVLTLEEAASNGEIPQALQSIMQTNSATGFVGPLDMVTMSINASVPPQYVLNPGDTVTIYYWGDMLELTSASLTLDDRGEISLPKGGRLVARGMPLQQFQKAVQDQLQRELSKNVKVIASMDKLKSIQIFIGGETFRPGTYSVSAVTTLFNALYAAGGPNANGSLRDIKLIRNGKTTSVDFYNYLLNGDGKADLPLQAGDRIFIGRVLKLISVTGEVRRPAVYELKTEETARDLIKMALGFNATGLSNTVNIQSVVPHQQRAVVTVDMRKSGPSGDHEVFDGDIVYVPPIVNEIKNMITLSGDVKVPGMYELKKDMRVADLFNDVNEPWGEAYLDRADVIRLDRDRKTTTIIPINLGKALAKDPANNIGLVKFDQIVVYSKWDVKFYPERSVAIRGSVQKPGTYVRSDGMRVLDLLLQAGNVLPDTYLDRADLIRYNFDTDRFLTIPVHLKKLYAGDDGENILLADKDTLRVYDIQEVAFTPPHEVDIHGNVQRPGTYTRSEGMRLKDLLLAAGGILPGSSNVAVISKARTYYATSNAISVNLDLLTKGDESQNVLLDDEDIVMIRENSDFYEKPLYVELKGEVKYPGKYPLLKKNFRLSELIAQAGGLTSVANPKAMIFLRDPANLPSDAQRNDVQMVDKVVNAMNKQEYQRQAIRNMILLQQETSAGLTAPASAISASNIAPVVSTGSSVKEATAAAMAPSIAQTTGQLTGSIVNAFTPGSGVVADARTLAPEQLTQSTRVIVNLEKALQGGNDNPENIVLASNDSITIPRKMETASIIGAVMNPVSFHVDNRQRIKDALKLSGGYSEDANTDSVIVSRVNGALVPADDIDYIEPGDIIYVPTKVVTAEIITTTDKIINALKFTLATAASVIVFLALIH